MASHLKRAKSEVVARDGLDDEEVEILDVPLHSLSDSSTRSES